MSNGKFTLKGLRCNLSLTQKDMAKLIGISPETWANYEKYDTFPNVQVIEKILKETGVGYNDIIFLPPDYGLTVISDKET